MAYNDIFGKNTTEYWYNEGCNKRMQKYKKVSNILIILQYILGLVFVLYLFWLALESLAHLQIGFNLCDKIICKDYLTIKMLLKDMISKLYCYLTCCIMALILYHRYIGNLDVKKIYKWTVLFILICPLLILININFMIYSTKLLTFFISTMFIFIIFFINCLKNKINFLYDVSVGNFIQKESKEEVSVVKENKKEFKEKKRRK